MAYRWELPALAEWRGKEVATADGKKLGTLEGIVYDYETVGPAWLGIGTGPLGAHLLLAPVGAAAPDGGRLLLEYSKEYLEAEPAIEVGEGWSYGEDAVQLYEYFGIPYSEYDDVRVLHRHDELPGQEEVA